MAYRDDALNPPDFSLREKLWQMHWLFILMLTATSSIGFVMLYSAAGGQFDPWAKRQIILFGAGVCALIFVALVDIRIWLKYAYVIYAMGLLLLVGVEFIGETRNQSTRWLELGSFRLQPSEPMKVALVLALARYYHGLGVEDVGRWTTLIIPVILAALPMVLILRQPDLGTAMMLGIATIAIVFMAGVRIWKFLLAGGLGLALAPVAWQFLRDYQKQRILTLFDPERDPLGAGYHIIQSKIAFGAGGFLGKGLGEGTQAHLNYLPERHTDFIFTMLAEEFGLVGSVGLLSLYLIIMIYGVFIAIRCRSHFGRLLGGGVVITFSLFAFINMAMVMGLIPVVGVPLPLVSYGGTAMMTLLGAFGLLMNVWIHRDVVIGRRGVNDEL